MSIRQHVWQGTLPLKVVLASNETRARETYEYFITVHRISYLPLYLKEMLDYFRPFMVDPSDAKDFAWWFEFEGVPLRWNWPIGLSFDLLTGLDPTSENEVLPWTLTLKRKDYPTEYIMALDRDSMEDYWLNQSKEACCVRDGNPKAIMSLSKKDSTELWKSVQEHAFDKYWNIMDRVLPHNYKNIPIKLYFPMSNQCRQALVRPSTDTGRQTVGSALHHHMPELFESARTCVYARPLIHGAVVPMDAPLVELYPIGMYLDGFLHISVVMMS